MSTYVDAKNLLKMSSFSERKSPIHLGGKKKSGKTGKRGGDRDINEPESCNISDLTPEYFATLLKYKLEKSDPTLLCFGDRDATDAFVRTVGYPIFHKVFESRAGLNHLPVGYVPGLNRGDGKCFIHAIVNTMVLYWFSKDNSGTVLNMLLSELFDVIRDLMPDRTLIMGLDEMNFVAVIGPVHEVLARNAVLINTIVYNAMIAVIHSWNDPRFMAHIPEHMRDQDAFDFRQNFGITHDDSGIVSVDSSVVSIDNVARCHICKLFGIQWLYVIQFTGTIRTVNKSGYHDEDMKRKTNPFYCLESVTIPGRAYSGFTVQVPEDQLLFRNAPLRMMIHTCDTSHYDIFISYMEGLCPTTCTTVDSDGLPDQGTFPGKEAYPLARDVAITFS